MIARQTLNIYIQYLKNLPRLRGYSLVCHYYMRPNYLSPLLIKYHCFSILHIIYSWLNKSFMLITVHSVRNYVVIAVIII